MKSIPCDIVLLPSSDIAQKAIILSEKLEKYDSRFTLKDGTFFPHVSLYMAQLKQNDLEKVKTALVRISAVPAFNLVATKYCQSQGYIDIEYRRNKAVAALQVEVIQAINPLRDGLLENDKARAQESTGQLQENFIRYGYPAVGNMFRPHLTFTRFMTNTPIPTDMLPLPDTFDGQFPRLGLFEMDSNNACVRKLAEFTFGSKA